MKLKKIRIRLKDIHHGKILYVAHPACGIDKIQVVGKPKTVMLGAISGLKGSPALFIDTIPLDCDWWDKSQVRSRSLSDMGVYDVYGYRRTFHTRKQAERYVNAMKYSPDFVRYWDDHLAQCDMMDDYYMDYNDH